MNDQTMSSAPPPICIVCDRLIPTYTYPTGPHGPYHNACSGERHRKTQPWIVQRDPADALIKAYNHAVELRRDIRDETAR